MKMFKNQTGRKNFLLTQTMLAFAAIASFSNISEAQITRCEGLFKDAASRTVVRAESADAFWLRSAQIANAATYSTALVEELGKAENEEPIYRQLIGPALWGYARLSVETGATTDRVTQMINGITKDIARQREQTRRRGDDHIRPKVMTGDERREAQAVGHYGFIEGARLPSVKSDAQKQSDAIMEMVSQAQRNYHEGARSDSAADPVRLEFESIKRRRMNEPSISKTEIDALLESPVEYAIVYAQLTGLMAHSGTFGDLLSPFVPWSRTAADPAKHRALTDLVLMGRATNAKLADQQTADALVLEVLRIEFAPHLHPAL